MGYRFFLWLLGHDHRVWAQIAASATYIILAAALSFVLLGEIYMAFRSG